MAAAIAGDSPTARRLFAVLHLEDAVKWTQGPLLWVNSLKEPEDEWRVFEVAREGKLPDLDDGYAGFVLTGARFNLSDPATAEIPFVAATISLVRTCLHAGEDGDEDAATIITASGKRVPKPRIVGGCFGAQLIAFALGGKITKNPTLRFVLKAEEIVPRAALAKQSFARGLVFPHETDAERACVVNVKDHEVGAPSPFHEGDAPRAHLFSRAFAAKEADDCEDGKVSPYLRVIESHGDCVRELPPHGCLLADSGTCGNEVFMVGRNILALQSHPEFDLENVIATKIWPAVVDDRKRLNEDEQRESKASFEKPRHSQVMIELIRRFLKGS